LGGGSASAAAPTVNNPVAVAVTGSGATLRGSVNPGGVAGSKWRFFWGASSCAVKPNSCKATGKVELPLGTSPVVVEKSLSGLTPGTVYHFILEAENSDGLVHSADAVFFTQGAPFEGLPDGRAYEQSSPVDKEGGDAAGNFALTKASTTGNGVSFFSTFGMPGGKGAQALPSYLSLRGEGQAGWVSQGLLPPPEFGERAQVQGWLPDFSKTYSNAARLGNPRTKALVEQSTSGGEARIVSPYTAGAEYSFVGASDDASVVLFESEAQLTSKEGGTLISAAVPGQPNVYAWSQATGEVSLAGVLNDGKAPPRGTIAGPYDWSRGTEARTLRSGGAKRGYYLRGTRAFSESGDIYFTEAGTGQLYLRTNPTRPQSTMEGVKCLKLADACTIHVSASKRTTPGPDPAGSQPAAFGASGADGSVAYFTSPEKLTDESWTGPEQPAAAIGSGSASGTIENEALVKAHSVGVATGTSHLYWADPAGTIGRSGLDGSDPDESFIEVPPGECEMEVEVGEEEFEVQKVAIPSTPRYVTVDAAEKYVYWTNSGLLNKASQPANGGGTIGRAELDGSGNLVPGSVKPAFICGEVEPGTANQEAAVSNPQGIAVNSEHVYWTNAAVENPALNRTLARSDINGGEVRSRFVAIGGIKVPYGVALDGTYIYFALESPGSPSNSYIERVTLAGTEPLEFHGFGVEEGSIRGLAIDATHIYWANQDEEAIWRVPLSDVALGNCTVTGTCEKLMEPKGDLNGLALSGTRLYWSSNGEAPSNPGNDLYRFEVGSEGGTLEDLTFVPPPGNGAEVQGVLGASADGSSVYFAANAILDGASKASQGDCENVQRSHGDISHIKGGCNIYLWQEGTVTYVGRVRGADATDWTGTPREVFTSFEPKSSFVATDGQTLVFASREKLTPYENEGVPELYRFRASEAALRCLSCPASGEAPGKGPSVGSVGFPGAISPSLTNMAMPEGRNLSSGGNRFFFETGEALVAGDTNGQGGCPGVGSSLTPACQDVYEWEAPDTGSCTPTSPAHSPLNEGCLYLVSTGKSTFPSYFGDASEDGSNVFFYTRQGLVGQDTDELQDVYDARVGGGIATQNQVSSLPCESSDSCHGSYPGGPAGSSPATPNFLGPQNPKPKHKKPAKHKAKKHKHKKKKQRQKKSQQHKRASADGGGQTLSPEPCGPCGVPPSHLAPRGPRTSAGGSGVPRAAWTLSITGQPSNFAPGGTPEYVLAATNVGAAPTSGTSTLEVTMPKAWKILNSGAQIKDPGGPIGMDCTSVTPSMTCETSEPVKPGVIIIAQVRVEVPPGEPEATLQAQALIKGGGAAQEAKVTMATPVQAEAVPPGILPGFAAPITGEEGDAATLAGSHPYQLTSVFGFPTENPGDGLTNDGHPRDFSVELPRGLLGSPAATPVLCTEAELTLKECPPASQVGIAAVTSIIGEAGNPDLFNSPLYNMVPPPGSAASLATNVASIGIYAHVLAGVRSDGDYGIEATLRDIIAFGQQPIFNLQTQIWGTPTAEVHDEVRGKCMANGGVCPPEERTEEPFLTLPADCPGQPWVFKLLADTWENPSPPATPYEASYESASLDGAPVAVEGCEGLEFEPSIQVRPTTNLTDSPSGLEVEIKQAQGTPERASSPLRDVELALPAGLAVNPAQASGLGACTQAQIGFTASDDQGPHFSKGPQSCPAAAKVGTVEVTSPLLVARDAVHKVLKDPETGEPVLEALKGSIYVATPFANPFGSLLAIYLVVEDEKTGVIAKLAGKGTLDPQTGQITADFEENPEFPLASVRAHIFGGARGALVTPPTCGPHAAATEMVPWSAPEGKDASPQSSFQMSSAPSGGPCASSEAQLPNAPKLIAGTESPAAAKYSPLLFKLSREDGTQRLGKIEATLPTGLLAKLAGVGECPEEGIAKAHSREAPQMGAAELADPSCPAPSQIGVATAAAGAGPNPFYTQGKVYLAGPYKGAPLSVVAIAPAVAGPFDLGAVVNRSALYLDPETGQGRIVSDPLPTILHGVPIDLRSVAVRAERSQFTLNPTSCDEKSFGGQAISTLGQAAPLFERFQVGGCKSLPYKPKFSARLKGPVHRGAHPSFRAVFTAGPGEANTAAISFTFPKSEFIDQAHFRTICTRVQFAANQCPAGSVYGHVTVHTPLLDFPLTGSAYLRSSSHKLPDLVLALRGPAYQPIALDAVGRVDSVNGGLRVRFQAVPDAPFSKVIFTAQGAKKGLFQNSTNICKGTHSATLLLKGQNGKVSDSAPKLNAQCKGKR
jgi:hypothetical protein